MNYKSKLTQTLGDTKALKEFCATKGFPIFDYTLLIQAFESAVLGNTVQPMNLPLYELGINDCRLTTNTPSSLFFWQEFNLSNLERMKTTHSGLIYQHNAYSNCKSMMLAL